ncbi:MAG TPA: alcohol dehydrogenase catalytic domain-containing protein [Croceibacterium sp.]|nr:alcohol dehydrogenase catalytic domain-containing protein [Croceibacterium sp.]
MPAAGDGEIRIRVRAAGVSPTDAKIRRGDLEKAFPLQPDAILGFEAAGVVDDLGPGANGVALGDAVAAFLPSLGGYAEYAIASSWTPKPDRVSWTEAAALPVAAEAAVGTLKELHVKSGESLLILGAAGAVGVVATQLALAAGLTVYAAAAPRDHEMLRELGAVPVRYGASLLADVRSYTDRVDAVLDAAGKGGLTDALMLAGGPTRVVTLADERAAELGVAFSAPRPDRAPEALDEAMQRLASGALRLRRVRRLSIDRASEAHELLENGEAHEKLVLIVGSSPGKESH